MSSWFNEGKAIDAVLRRIEAREGTCRRDDGWSPDQGGRRSGIDYACSIGDRLFALEHTGIEPFPNYITILKDTRRLVEPIEAHFAGTPSSSEFRVLSFPIEATVGMKSSDFKRVRKILTDWLEESAEKFPLVPYGDAYANTLLGETIEGVPFPVSVHRWTMKGGPLGGRFAVLPCSPENLESARLVRLRKACEDKFEKLAEWKLAHGAHSVLVLEENDISLTNHQLVAEALIPAEATMVDCPDEIFLVSTHIKPAWWVTCLRRDGKSYYDDGERFWEFDPAELVPLTDR